MEQAHTWRGEEEVKTSLNANVYARFFFYFVGRDTIECVVEFRIDNRTIKRVTLKKNCYLRATRCDITLPLADKTCLLLRIRWTDQTCFHFASNRAPQTCLCANLLAHSSILFMTSDKYFKIVLGPNLSD